MAEYIEREYVLKCMEDSYKNAGISAEAKAKMTRWLNKAPAADVRPVVRGHWFDGACVNCGFKPALDYEYATVYDNYNEYRWNYCPNCGADMREES